MLQCFHAVNFISSYFELVAVSTLQSPRNIRLIRITIKPAFLSRTILANYVIVMHVINHVQWFDQLRCHVKYLQLLYVICSIIITLCDLSLQVGHCILRNYFSFLKAWEKCITSFKMSNLFFILKNSERKRDRSWPSRQNLFYSQRSEMPKRQCLIYKYSGTGHKLIK